MDWNLYFLGLSFRNTAKALSFLLLVKISHVSIWNWIQKYRPWKYIKKKLIKEYIIDETIIKAGSETIWLWVIVEPKNKEILATNILKKRNISIAKRFLSHVVNKYGFTCCFVRWWHLVPWSLQILEPTPSYSLCF